MLTATNEAPRVDALAPESAGRAPGAGYRVVVLEIPADRESLLRQLRRELDLNAIDSRIQLHHLPGVLPRGLSADDAGRVAAAIREAGGEAVVLTADEWPDLNRIPPSHHLRCTDCGLEVVSVDGVGASLIPWAHVRLISVADVPLEGVRHFVAPRTAVIRATPSIKEAQLETRTLRGAEMWIVSDRPFRAIRIDHREMNYEYLGRRLTGSAAANFRLFLEEVVSRAPHARLTPTTQAFLAHGGADHCRLASADEHRKQVALEAVRLRLRTETREHSPRNEELSMTATHDASPTGGLHEAHAALHRDIDGLNEGCHEAEELGQPRCGQLGLRVKALRDHVAEHFAQEERGGYMSPVVAADPRFAAPAEELLGEHARILARFDDVVEKLGGSPCAYTCWSEGQRDICSVLSDLRRHEHAENELWQSAFDDESGGAD